ncbi:hypothetical protein [Roseiconus lacunae]|uniref:DUF1795 domain-containing protein n=1 Tax=Roseiconus lacunae TaxID=2605694 RepID=A0ABT7PJ16_9BACT|nr:hypothetical protein [Roseiconus lacunae]MCD0458406.1 hypothetical protein [Roseiconus lacunae]MDM4016294.1 hypothetical protein [Roseiconus lacunae]WRQ52103.1 hypothetical protein U8335_06070 [Stieleria sp. HD01]
MPSQFDGFGIRFLYPENWEVVQRDEDEGDQGVTLDFPGAGFLSIERTQADRSDHLIEGIIDAIEAEYEQVERDETSMEILPTNTPVTDLRFYYLDLMIVSRLLVLDHLFDSQGDDVLVVQLQAESRDFDKNEPILSAILKQILDSAIETS